MRGHKYHVSRSRGLRRADAGQAVADHAIYYSETVKPELTDEHSWGETDEERKRKADEECKVQ